MPLQLPSLLPAIFAIVVWSSLALLSTLTAGLPPLFTTGVALTIGGLAGLIRLRDWRVPLRTFAVGLGGIFGYHALLFTAFKFAPAIEVSLLNYLWPLLIVLLSPLVFSGLRLTWRHVLGALLGLAGALLIASGGSASMDGSHLVGYLMAVTGAFVWALYSLFTKRLPPFPTGAVGGFCLASGLLSLLLFWIEGGAAFSLPSPRLEEWLALLALGLGPMGLAFYAWDAAMKKGDPRVIGSLAYLTPLLATFNLVVFGGRELTVYALVALVLIVGGATLSSMDGRRSGAEGAVKG